MDRLFEKANGTRLDETEAQLWEMRRENAAKRAATAADEDATFRRQAPGLWAQHHGVPRPTDETLRNEK